MPRDVSFFDSLGRLLALEREAERARMEALAEGMSLQQRAEQGLSFLDLESIEEEVGLGGRVLVTLARKDRARFPARLDNGDQVAVFPRRSEIKDLVVEEHPDRVLSRDRLEAGASPSAV
ncbi:hypothetical protein [Archangium sp.]|uniref:hypothetical protein n=1 Tax=Archangium sp. TaxID=1872627 RepID=UPI00389A7335